MAETAAMEEDVVADGPRDRFEIKQWNAVAMWAWGTGIEESYV
jgi:hypothetical protein